MILQRRKSALIKTLKFLIEKYIMKRVSDGYYVILLFFCVYLVFARTNINANLCIILEILRLKNFCLGCENKFNSLTKSDKTKLVCCIKQIINFSHLGISLITLDMHYVVVRRLDTFTEHAKKSKLRT